MKFRDDFVWGAATSSYQIEGAQYEGGKGLHLWDEYVKQKGKVFENQRGDVSCDHYHLFREDVKLMKELGLKAYRFSVDWTRIMPEGKGKVNEEGVAFYNALIDELVANDIEPYLTLFHWELPMELYKRGGWMNPDMPEWFAQYAAVIADRFSDRVKNFFTVNEPQCFVGLSFSEGVHAPWLQLPDRETILMSHNALKAHGRAVQELRAHARQPLVIGYAPTSGIALPATDKPEDIEAARQAYFGIPQEGTWAWNTAWWSDPVIFGKYPEEFLVHFEKDLPKITDDDMKLISEPIDIYGQNIYLGYPVCMGEDGKPELLSRNTGYAKSASNWPMTPEALYWGPKFLYDRYKKPIFITENGLACHDWIHLDGKIHDPSRIDFTARYLGALKRAAQEADIRGYFAWSLMDNFEWAEGFGQRYGLVFVDFKTQKRIPKDSAYWYRDVIRTNGENL